MSGWSTDISNAPRGRYVVGHRKFGRGEADTEKFACDWLYLATKCGQVIHTYYLPEERRWAGLATGEHPLAWHSDQKDKPFFPTDLVELVTC